MPIKKFLYIKNIGRLVNCAQKGSPLQRYNLIFAGNGRGKTTLCAVLRSLQTGKPEYITERVTLASGSNIPEASIRLDAENITYNGQSWGKTIPEIAIFDSTFVAQNVYAGECVTRDHRINLLQVIIGETDINLVKAIENLRKEIRENNSEITRAQEIIQPHLPNNMKVEKFLKLEEDPNIESKIDEQRDELRVSQQSEKIIEHPALMQITVPTLPSNFEAVLAKTLADIATDAETQVMKQLTRHNMHDGGQAWILEGLEWIRDDACPFCGQDITELALIQSYKQFFSASYTALIDEIANLQQDITDKFGEAELEKLGAEFVRNENILQFWKPLASAELTGMAKLTEIDHNTVISEPARALRKAAFSLIKSKHKNPLIEATLSDVFQEVNRKCGKAADHVDAYNKQVVAMNSVIEKQRKKAKLTNSISIEKRMTDLELIKLRYDSKIVPLCSKYKTLLSTKAGLSKKLEIAKANLNSHGSKIIGSYEKTINKLLNEFGASFSITKSEKTYVGDTPSSAYKILINKKTVPLGNDKTPLGKPCFRTTLSAGDKSTLALAFFLAQLDHNPKKKDCIVVFDDPVSSLDRGRREYTAELLMKCGKESAQLLLFSHDPFFLNCVYSKLPKDDWRSLQLSCVPGSTTAIETSTIEEWDPKEEIKSTYLKDYDTLASYLKSGEKNLDRLSIARRIRPVLEFYLHHRFPHKFTPNEGLGAMIDKIKKLPQKSSMHSMIGELESIKNFSNRYHHDSPHIDNDELRGYVKRALGIIHNGETIGS